MSTSVILLPLITTMARMRELAMLSVHLIATLATCLRPGAFAPSPPSRCG
jgi:hypothetical protein